MQVHVVIRMGWCLARSENDTEYNQRYASLGLEDAVLSMGQQVKTRLDFRSAPILFVIDSQNLSVSLKNC